MTNDDDLDVRLAQTSAELLKTALHLARLREPHAADEITNLQAVKLTVTASHSQIKLDLTAPYEGGILLIYSGTFSEAGPLH